MTTTLLALFLLGIAGAFLFVQVRDVLQRQAGSGLVLLTGFLLLYVGEAFYDETGARPFVSGAGILVVLGAVGLRYFAMGQSEGARHEAHQQALIWTSISAASLVLYALSLEPVTNALAFSDEGRDRWVGVWWSLFPIVSLIGLLPTLLVDRVLALHPVLMPQGAIRSLTLSGVAAALAVCLMFPVNYLAHESDLDYDAAYFRTTEAGEASRAIARTLDEPVEAILFFPKGNDVAREVERYFKDLEGESEGRFAVRLVDQALDPELAEELKIRDNGNIVLRRGEATEKFKLNLDFDKAKRELRKLDSTVQKHLMKLTRGQRTIYFLSGHGEADWREREDQFRKINLFKRDLLEGALGVKVETFGVTDGSTSAVPDDAALVVVAGPTEPLLPEEVATLARYYDGGGSLWIMVDPEGDPLTDLLDHLGLEPGKAVLANAAAHAQLTGGPADNVYIATNKYGSHASVKELSRNSSVAHMVFAGATAVSKKEGATARITTLIRSANDTWEDLDGDFAAGPDERKAVYDVAAASVKELPEAAEGERKEARAIVVGDVGFLSDLLVSRLRANAVFALDAYKWLTHDEEIAGEVESEEDVKILHTREEDQLWFLTVVLAVPSLVMLAGVLFIRSRQRRN